MLYRMMHCLVQRIAVSALIHDTRQFSDTTYSTIAVAGLLGTETETSPSTLGLLSRVCQTNVCLDRSTDHRTTRRLRVTDRLHAFRALEARAEEQIAAMFVMIIKCDREVFSPGRLVGTDLNLRSLVERSSVVQLYGYVGVQGADGIRALFIVPEISCF